MLDATVNGASSYSWNTGDNTPQITVSNEGLYYVTVMTNNCSVSDSVIVKEMKRPTVYLGPDTTICNSESVQIAAKGTDIESYKWSTGSMNSFITANIQGLYTVIASNRCGIVSDDIAIRALSCSEDIYFPSAFTPNGDNLNDRFKALYSGLNIPSFHLSVLNRWGQLVFKSDDISKGWDGKINGEQQASGTFVWYATYKKEQSTQLIRRKGTVLLIR
jgi:gliding motility-associated-like protein